MQLLDDIPFVLDVDALLKRAHLESGTEDAAEFRDLACRASAEARPKALYKECYIDAKGDDTVIIDGVTFTSHALRRNLEEAERVFAFIATCGRELDQIDIPQGDFLKRFWLDSIKTALLGVSLSHLAAHLNKRYTLGKSATMSPGSSDVTVWPIEQQKELFSLFGDSNELIGVELTDSFLMIPNKSVSGIRFPTELDFHGCQLCHRAHCPSRSAPFCSALWESIEHEIESRAKRVTAPDNE